MYICMSGFDDIRVGLFANGEYVETHRIECLSKFLRAITCVVRTNSSGYSAIAAQFFLWNMIIQFHDPNLIVKIL